MKQLFLSLALLLTFAVSFGHVITPIAYCSIKGKVTLENTQFTIGAGKVAHFYITKNGTKDSSASNPVIWRLNVDLSHVTSNELNDSVGQITNSGFKINVPQVINSSHTGVEVNSFENDAYGNTVWSTVTYKYTNLTNVCLALPITFSSVVFQPISDTEAEVIFTVATVTGINTVNVQISFDNGASWETRAIVFPDDTQPNKTYVVKFRSTK